MIIKTGHRGPQVAEIQQLLNAHGYDLLVDGDYGLITERAVIDYQLKNNLQVTGKITTETYNNLLGHKAYHTVQAGDTLYSISKLYSVTIDYIKKVNSLTSNEISVGQKIKLTGSYIINEGESTLSTADVYIDRSQRLSENQYLHEVHPKTQIFIHHTASGPDAQRVINYWDSNAPRISTAYVIDKTTGIIYETFNPDYWSWHLGVMGTNGKMDRASIGIELCAWGHLEEKNGKFYNWTGRQVARANVIELDTPFRTYKYFESYSTKQMESLDKLLRYLIRRYNIVVNKPFDMSWYEYNQSVIDNATPGIWTHTTVRENKFDTYPDWRTIDLLNSL